MEKESVELFERVKKAGDAAAAVVGTDSSKEEDRCLDALNRLKGLPINYDVLISTQDKNRDKVRMLIADALSKVAREVGKYIIEEVDACDPFRVATEVESAMFAKWGLFNGAQKMKYRSIMFNIKDPSNFDFRRKVLLGQFPPMSIIDLSPEDMASDERKEQNEKIKEKALFDCERIPPSQGSSNGYKCGRCNKNECTYYQLQTRSADEPMTIYVTCVNCGSRWRICC